MCIMKICTKCLLSQDIDCFGTQTKAADGHCSWCKGCFKKYRKFKYNEDLQKNRLYGRNRRSIGIKWVQELKSNVPCVDCGQIYEPYCMDYDHVAERGKKIKSVSRMVLENAPQIIILKEIEKCDLVCLLCHNKRTYMRFNNILGNNRKYSPNCLRNIEVINQFKNKPCAMCNKQYESYNMQIDHIDPFTKLYNICQLKSFKLETLQTELDKCQVLCALCHRKKSIIEQQDNKYPTSRPPLDKPRKLFFDPITGTKECGICHKIKNSIEFRTKRDTTSKLDTYCKDCFNEYRRDRRKKPKA